MPELHSIPQILGSESGLGCKNQFLGIHWFNQGCQVRDVVAHAVGGGLMKKFA